MRTATTLRAVVTASPSVLGLVAWLVAAGLVAKSIPNALHEHVMLAQIAVYGVAIIGGLGGLVGFLYSADSIEFFVRGYRIRRVNPTQWVYEERAADGSIDILSFGYKSLADGYRPLCEVWLPSHEHWDEEVPAWAQNRRSEIAGRIATCLGADFERSVQFVDSHR